MLEGQRLVREDLQNGSRELQQDIVDPSQANLGPKVEAGRPESVQILCMG
jgi:hypothetical protein